STRSSGADSIAALIGFSLERFAWTTTERVKRRAIEPAGHSRSGGRQALRGRDRQPRPGPRRADTVAAGQARSTSYRECSDRGAAGTVGDGAGGGHGAADLQRGARWGGA